MDKLNVLMLGPARNVKGGMTSVVDSYYDYGLDKKVNLKYIETINDKNKISKFISEVKGYIEFEKYIDKYDIVHIHMASRRSTFRKGKYVKIAKNKGKKVIIHLHGAEFKVFINECNFKQRQYVEKILNLADKIVVLSEEWKEYMETLIRDKDKIIIIHNAIIIPKDFNKNLDTQKILFLGRIGKRKGIYDLIDVFKNIIYKYPNAHLYVGGDGEVENFKKIIRDNKLMDNVSYIGWTSGKEKEKYLKECSFFCLPSYNEGMPMALIEGMAYKNIAISTNVGGIPRLIEDGVNGFCIEPGDKERLQQILEKLLNKDNADKREQISINARKTIKNKFDIKKNIENLLKIYNEMG